MIEFVPYNWKWIDAGTDCGFAICNCRENVMKHTAMLAIVAVFITAPISAQAAPTERIGSAVQVVNEVRAEFEQDRRDLTSGDEVHQDELIEVGPRSIGELEFADETKLALGPGSRLLLDKFVYNGQSTKGDIIVNLVKGTFRFITGLATKTSYRIRTPGAAITVRGTIFDVFVADDDTVWLLLLEGGITACNDRGNCKELSRPGRILRVAPDGEVSDPMRWALLPGNEAIGFAVAFPFMVTAPSINPNPPLTRQAVLDPEPPKKKSKAKKAKKKKVKKSRRTSKSKKKVTKKKTYKRKRTVTVRKKKRRVVKKRRRPKRNSDASNAAAAAIAIGIGIGLAKGFKKKKHRGGGGKHYPNRY